MPLVSKYPLSKAVEEECFDLLYGTISALQKKKDVKELLDDFLSPVEQIMLAKRLGIAVLLAKGYTYDQIRRILRVTPPTIAMVNIAMKYSGKGYKKLVENVLAQERWRGFWQKIDDLLSEVAPPKGQNWSYWRKERWQRKMREKKVL